MCTIWDGAKWCGKAAARCRDCVYPDVNICEAPPHLWVHQYLNKLDPVDWAGNLLSLQAFLMTQARAPVQRMPPPLVPASSCLQQSMGAVRRTAPRTSLLSSGLGLKLALRQAQKGVVGMRSSEETMPFHLR